MNFTDYINSISDPLYEEEGKGPKCGVGLKWDKELKMCVPDPKSKTEENPGDKYKIDPPMFNVWGDTGINGDGYALEEPRLKEMYTQHSEKQRRSDEESAKNYKEMDDRMKYGKKGKPPEEEELLPGEVKTWDKFKKAWVSNKRGK